MPLDPKRLGPELERWRAAGWVDADGAEKILADAEARQSAAGAPQLLALLGATLFCLAVAAFIAASWPAIPRPGKLALCLALIWAAYAAAALARRRGATALAHAAALIGAGLFGSGLVLVSQMYHLSGDWADLFLVWSLGALATGAVLTSAPSLVLAGLLAIAWDIAHAALWDPSGALRPAAAHLPFLALWAALAAALGRAGWPGGAHLVALGALYWTLQLGFRLLELSSDGAAPWLLPAAIGAAGFALGIVGDRAPGWRPGFEALRPGLGRLVAVYGFLAAMTALLAFALQRLDAQGFGAGEALLLLVPSVGALWIGAQARWRALIGWSAAWLSIALATIYVATVGTLLGTAAFFLATAAGVALVAWVAWRLDRHARGGAR